MEKAKFWRMIDEAKAKSGGDCDEQVDLIGKALLKLLPEEIVKFDRILDELTDEAYRWDLWGAAYLINGGCSDDGFYYFRCWLIAQGEEIFQNTLNDPDSLADYIDPDFAEAECEPLLYVAGMAYEKITMQEIPIDTSFQASRLGDPIGVKWEDEELDSLFPRICEKIG